MGSLKEVESGNESVHLLFTNSSKAELFIYDTLKKVCGATRESVYEIETKRQFNDMLELANMHPYLSDMWLFIIDYSKLKGICKQNKGVFQSNICQFLVKVNSYKDYKEFKSVLGSMNDMYLVRLRADEVMYLLKGYCLSQKLINFISATYASDVEKVFELREKLEQGFNVSTPKEVVSLVGAGGSSVNKYALQLLSDPPKTEKGFKMVYRNRIKDAKVLADTYGVMSFRNFLSASVKDILDIKMLYNQGIIFKTIRDLPEMYDEKRLSRYNYCLERITQEIPYQRILRLYCNLKSSIWRSDKDMLEFIYKYYGGV